MDNTTSFTAAVARAFLARVRMYAQQSRGGSASAPQATQQRRASAADSEPGTVICTPPTTDSYDSESPCFDPTASDSFSESSRESARFASCWNPQAAWFIPERTVEVETSECDAMIQKAYDAEEDIFKMADEAEDELDREGALLLIRVGTPVAKVLLYQELHLRNTMPKAERKRESRFRSFFEEKYGPRPIETF